eukprot:TRINITY_DN55115_c0_g1_i1.p1 TRINITY_DN55115_c0_g1~~TRINITY_DN55115_c0_g1_i1.p1  ORF type:complete len:793 (-),score=131.52 TRINITY_DN55115_c0_g1_i1:46-2424(-)
MLLPVEMAHRRPCTTFVVLWSVVVALAGATASEGTRRRVADHVSKVKDNRAVSTHGGSVVRREQVNVDANGVTSFEHAPRGRVHRSEPIGGSATSRTMRVEAEHDDGFIPPPPHSLLEVTEKHADHHAGSSDLGSFALSSSGVLGSLVENLVRWLRGSATFQEAYATDEFRKYLVASSSAAEVATNLEDAMLPQEWAECASENYECPCASGVVRYGHKSLDKWLQKNVSRPGSTERFPTLPCTNAYFGGDPIVGASKVCECMALWRVVTCRDGLPVNWNRCPKGSRSATHLLVDGTSFKGSEITGELLCSEGCDRGGELGAASFVDAGRGSNGVSSPSAAATSANATADSTGSGGPATKAASGKNNDGIICTGREPNALLWSCKSSDYVDHSGGRPSSRQEVFASQRLDESTRAMCANRDLAKQLEIYLDCDFKDNYLHWSRNGTDTWLDEAFVTYIGGGRGSVYEWQATNLIRSVELFSSRPIIVVSFTDHYAPPLAWRNNRQVLVYRMHPGLHDVSFNFNKIRAMISSRILTGIQLDTDQIVVQGIDKVFESTRREAGENYPYPILPVHWMSRDAKEGQPYFNYVQTGYDGPRTMRWGQAHPTWTNFALPWLTDLLRERLTRPSFSLPAWMHEDEDMLNVKLWQTAGANKQWCKFDLFPDLFVRGKDIDKNVYSDAHWYPQGIGLAFYTSHATKEFNPADWLLALLVRCSQPSVQGQTSCKEKKTSDLCWGNWIEERKQRLLKPEMHTLEMCCCLRPRESTPFFYRGEWYSDRTKVPDMRGDGNGTCIFP